MPTVGGKILAAAGVGAALAAVMASKAFASQPADIQMLQTAASIEVLAVATYKTALTLPFIGGASANGVVKVFAQMTMGQHQQHEQAFNAAITRLNGTPQMNPDPALLKVVNQAKPGLTGPEPVVALALELEQGAAETYVANVGALSDSNAKAVTASIMGVEAQHAAILRAVQALLLGNAPQLIALPPSPLSSLPAAAGSVGFPDAFFPTNAARPATEGAMS
jgi:bacterioferritin (cytochrome b1)